MYLLCQLRAAGIRASLKTACNASLCSSIVVLGILVVLPCPSARPVRSLSRLLGYLDLMECNFFLLNSTTICDEASVVTEVSVIVNISTRRYR